MALVSAGLWIVRTAAIGALLLSWRTAFNRPPLPPTMAPFVFLWFVGSLPFQPLYALVLSRTWTARREATAILAIGTGFLALSVSGLILSEVVSTGPKCSGLEERWLTVPLIPVCQVALIGGGLMLRRGVPWVALRVPLRELLFLVLSIFISSVLLFQSLPSLRWRIRIEVRASDLVRRVQECARSHASRDPASGFPASLSAMTPPRSDCLPPQYARGETAEYFFRYEPGPPDTSGRITRYSVIARPREWGCTSWMSFHGDESGKVHRTNENRPATLADPW